MKTLKRVTIQLVPDSSGIAYQSTQVSYEVGTTDDASFSYKRVLNGPISVPDETSAQAIFNDVIDLIKQTEGLS